MRSTGTTVVLTKGHAGVAVLPALLAAIDSGVAERRSRVLTYLVLGYGSERAPASRFIEAFPTTTAPARGMRSRAPPFAVACWSSTMRRCTKRSVSQSIRVRAARSWRLPHPSMLKDGSSFGAHAGITAALLARNGITGAPAVTVTDDGVRDIWNDLGTRWRIREQYFKAYPVCRWAQPAIEAALSLKRTHGFDAADVVRVRIESFREAIDLGSQCPAPVTTDDAQYSRLMASRRRLSSIASVPPRSRPGPSPIRGRALLAAIELAEDAEFSARFPAERWARLRITLADGRTLVSEPARARGNPENPLSDAELLDKYRALATPVLGLSAPRASRRSSVPS